MRVAVLGAGGRMGAALRQALAAADETQCSGALVRPGSDLVGQSAGTGVRFTDQPVMALEGAQVAIDFSLPEAFNSNLNACVEAACPVVIGTTGLSQVQHQRMRDRSHEIPIVWSPNMSVGVNLCFHLAVIAARVLGDDYDAEIIDVHHRHKRDAPSGTALAFGKLIAAARNQSLDEVAVYRGRSDERPRHPGEIGFSAVRAGEVVGEHQVMFAADGEVVELRHHAASRRAFADGALRAARWVRARDPGLYAMADVLQLPENKP